MGLTANIAANKITANITNKSAKVSANITSNKITASFKGKQGIEGPQGDKGDQGVQGDPGQGVPASGVSRQTISKVDGTDYNTEWRSNWYDYAMNVEYTGVEATIASGDILECIIDGNTIYRFINNTNGANGYPIEDSFYTNFDATNLTNLIVSRG